MTKIFLLNKSEHNKKRKRNVKGNHKKAVSMITTIIKIKSTLKRYSKQKKKRRKNKYQ